jgi:hypothetical protein
VQGGTTTEPSREPPTPRTLYPGEVQAQALPNSYSQPLPSDERGFVFRTVTALSMSLPSDHYLNSQQKRTFQAIVSDSSAEGLVQELVGQPWARPSPAWSQALPNTGTVATVARPPETMGGREGTIEARSGLFLRFYVSGSAHAVVHLDLVLRPPAQMRVNSLLSLDDFYSLLLVPAASVRDEIAPVLTASLSGNDEPTVIAQTVVALPNQDTFEPYLNLSVYARDRVPEASGPSAVHWNATSTSDLETPGAWKNTVIRMIDRLFSGGGYMDYDWSIARLESMELDTH